MAPNYDFIVWAAGDNTAPVAVQSYRTALEAYVAAGGKLLIEGGELAYDSQSYPGYPTFCANVLHVLDWTHDRAATWSVYDGSHPLTTFPNIIGPITFSYANYGDQDASLPTADAEMVCNWSSVSERRERHRLRRQPEPAERPDRLLPVRLPRRR